MRAYIEGDARQLQPRLVLLVVGSARSGTTAVATFADSHPAVVCANESDASEKLWRGMDGTAIKAAIVASAQSAFAMNRQRDDYVYHIRQATKRFDEIEVLADKIYTPSLLFLHGDARLIDSLSQRLSCPVKLVYCLRDPRDVIATMHRRSGASLRDRTRWYFNHCEAIAALLERGTDMTPVYHEQLIMDPVGTASRIFNAIGVAPPDQDGLQAIRDMLYAIPRKTREQVTWPDGSLRDIETRMRAFDFLSPYACEDSWR